MIKKISRTLLIFTAFSSSVFAAGSVNKLLPKKAPSGFNIGVTAGVGFGKAGFQSQVAIPPYNAAVSGKTDKTSFVGALSCDYQHNTAEDVTLGVGVSVLKDTGEFRKNIAMPPFPTGLVPTLTSQLRRTWVVELTPSIRKDVGGVTFVGGFGPSWTSFKGKQIFTAGNIIEPRDFTATKLGFTVALGAEFEVGDKVSLLGNISYTSYGTIRKNLAGFGDPAIANQVNTVSFKTSHITPAVTLKYQL